MSTLASTLAYARVHTDSHAMAFAAEITWASVLQHCCLLSPGALTQSVQATAASPDGITSSEWPSQAGKGSRG